MVRSCRRFSQVSVLALMVMSACGGPGHDLNPRLGEGTDTLQSAGITKKSNAAVVFVEGSGNAASELRVSVPFDLRVSEDGEMRTASSLEQSCLDALDYQNRLEEKYIEGKMKLLRKLREMTGNDATNNRLTTKNPLSMTLTFNGRSTDLNTDRKSTTTGSGGSSTVAGGSAGGGATGVTVQAPSATVVDEGLFTGTIEFSAGVSLTKPLGNTVLITEIPADETHLLQEATNAFYRTPIFCNIMKQCKGLGLPEKNHETATYCGGSSFSFGGGSSGGSGGGAGGPPPGTPGGRR